MNSIDHPLVSDDRIEVEGSGLPGWQDVCVERWNSGRLNLRVWTPYGSMRAELTPELADRIARALTAAADAVRDAEPEEQTKPTAEEGGAA